MPQETNITIQKKPQHIVTINKKTFVVELRNVDLKTLKSTDVVSVIGTGKNLSDAVLVADRYLLKQKDPNNLDMTLSTQFIEE